MPLFSSKNTLPPSLLIPKPVVYFARFLQFLSSKLALLFATKLFTTPISFSTPKREKPMLESFQNKKFEIPTVGKEIHLLSYGFSNKKVLLVHGWSGRSTQLYMMAHQLLENGYMVISFDGPAHGKSSGKTTNMLEFVDTITAIDNEFGPFEAAVGHSFGSMALLNVSARKEIFKCIVTIGGADKVPDILANFSQNIGLKKSFGIQMEQYFEKKWNIQLHHFAASEVAKKVAIPTLVVHDAKDGDVSVSCAINIRQNLQKGSLYITNRLGHTKILRDKKVTTKIINFIIKNT